MGKKGSKLAAKDLNELLDTTNCEFYLFLPEITIVRAWLFFTLDKPP